MASADDYAAWIVKNADKKGTPEFQTVSAAYQQAKQEESRPPPPSVPAPGVAGQFVTGAAEAIKPTAEAIQHFFTGLPQGSTEAIANVGRKMMGQGPLPQPVAPQSKAESLARTLGQMTPNAIMPGSALSRTASVVLPTLGAEGAGVFTDGSPMEKPARLAGALLGGAAAGMIGRGQDVAEAVKSVPSIENIKKTASSLYDKVKEAGVVVKDTAFKNFADSLQEDMKEAGIDPTITPKANAALSRIIDAATVPSGQNAPKDLSLNEVNTLRKVASKASLAPDKEDRNAARMIVDRLDDFISNLSPKDVRAGDAPQAVSMLDQARNMWRTASKSEMVQGLIDKAKAPGDLTTLDDALRSQFKKFAGNARAMGRFTPEEQNAIKAVAKGGPIQNVMSVLGRMAPSTSGLGAAAGAAELGAALGTHNPNFLIPAAVGVPAKAASTLTRSQNAQLAAAIARGAKAPAAAAPASNIVPGLSAQLAAILQSGGGL